MGKELFFYPAPPGLPAPVRPSRGESDTAQMIQTTNWRGILNIRDDSLVRAGALWLYGFLHEAHEIVQENRSTEGSYWHGLVHRSEGDFSNSLYWFGRVGKHAIFPMLRAAVQAMEDAAGRSQGASPLLLQGSEWDSGCFVDLCQQAYSGRVKDLELLQRIAAKEYDLLMAYTLKQQAP
jgi:hypothetical protein